MERPKVVAGKISATKPERSERSAALFGGDDDFSHVARFGGGKYFYQLGDDGAGESSAGDDDGEFPPLGRVATEIGDDEGGDQEGEGRWR